MTALTAVLVCGWQSTQAQTCTDPVAGDFRIVTLADNATSDLYGGNETGNYGVVQMSVAPDGKVFIAKMCSGEVQVYHPTNTNPAATVLAGTVPTHCDNEDGLLGIVVDRNYMSNKWVYVFHTDVNAPTSPANADTGKAHILTRYTYDSAAAPGNQLKSPKRILRFGRMIDSRAYHAAGGLDMGSDGVMVIGTGDDTSPHSGECSSNNSAPILYTNRGCDAQKSSSNTASLRGKILRIRPLPFPDSETPAPGVGTTYSIPPGNLIDSISVAAFNPNWNPAEDTLSKVRPEIYSMGHRNPYHPRIDTKSGWVFTGEVGLDAGSPTSYNPTRGPEGREEWNLVTKPGFFGHPYCVTGPTGNDPWRKYENGAWSTTEYHDCAAPRNVSPNNYGIVNLPPATPAALWYSNNSSSDDGGRLGTNAETAVGGPMYRYDTAMASSIKFPPQYEGKIFFFDWSVTSKNSFRVLNMNPNGTIAAGAAATPAAPFASIPANNGGLPNGSYIDMRFGPHDGAMYLLKGSSVYNSFNSASLYRVEYTGAVNNACYTPFVTTVGPGPVSIARQAIRRTVAPAVLANGLVTFPVGYRTVTLYDLSGRKVWSHTRAHADRVESVRTPARIATGILQARLTP